MFFDFLFTDTAKTDVRVSQKLYLECLQSILNEFEKITMFS